MAFSPQFRALASVTVAFTGGWAAIGGVLALWRGDPDVFLGYAALGAISGIFTALVIARAEAGRQVDEVATRRMAGWGAVGGLAPSMVMGLLGLVFGAPASAYLPLIGLGVVSAGMGGALAGSVAAVAKRQALPSMHDKPKLPAT